MYNSVFFKSNLFDIQLGNLSPFSVRNNTSLYSRMFFFWPDWGIGSLLTLQGNTVIEPEGEPPIYIGTAGPNLILDNAIKTRPDRQMGGAIRHDIPGWSESDFICVGNTYTIENPVTVNGRLRTLDEKVVPLESFEWAVPPIPRTPPNRHRPILEVPPGADAAVIQASIDEAAELKGRRPVVHLPAGTYKIDRTVVIPGGCDVRLIGDGNSDGATNLLWVGPGINGWERAGVMMREDLAGGSKYAMIAMIPGPYRSATFQYRRQPGDTTATSPGENLRLPYWVRLERKGDTFTGYLSPDGVHWARKSGLADPGGVSNPVDLAMAGAGGFPPGPGCYIGLCVTSAQPSVACPARFDNVTTAGNVLDVPGSAITGGSWVGQDIGGSRFVGSASYDPTTGTWTVTGDGQDIGGYSDEFRYVYKYLAGDGSITARVVSIGEPAGPVLRLMGPSRATLRELLVNPGWSASGVVVDDCDQAGARVFMSQTSVSTGQVGLLSDGLRFTDVSLYNFGDGTCNTAVKVVGADDVEPNDSGRVVIFSGASGDNMLSYDVARAGRLLARDMWYETGYAPGGIPTFLNLTGSGELTLEGISAALPADANKPAVTLDDFSGKVSLLNVWLGSLRKDVPPEIVLQGPGKDTNLLVLGVVSGVMTEAECDGSYFHNQSAYARYGLLNSSWWSANSAGQQFSKMVPEEGEDDPNFLREMLSQTRRERPYLLTPLADGVTDVRFYRVVVTNHSAKPSIGVAIHLKGRTQEGDASKE